MKLVIVNAPTYEYAIGNPTKIGGAERQQWLLARALVKVGWSVTVGVRGGLKNHERATIDGVNFVGIGSGQFLWACYRFLISESPDWWYWRVADHLLGPAVQVARFAAVRTIFAAAFDTDVEPRCASFRRAGWWPLYAWGLARTDKIFVQHSGQLARLATKWKAKAYVVPSLAGAMPIGLPHRQRQGYVAWVGILRRPKRADFLIEIAKRLPAIQFVVCGGISTFKTAGEEYGRQIVQALKALPNVDYRGQVEPKETQKIIAGANILLSTSDGEGFPNTFLEAWTNGTPVVSLTIDPDRIIEEKGLGAVSGNVPVALEDIQALMADPDRRQEIAIRAQAYVSERHSPDAVTKIFVRSLEKT